MHLFNLQNDKCNFFCHRKMILLTIINGNIINETDIYLQEIRIELETTS